MRESHSTAAPRSRYGMGMTDPSTRTRGDADPTLEKKARQFALDPRAQQLTETLREFYRLCEPEPEAGALCRLWTRSRHIAADLTIEWEPVGNHIRQQGGAASPDDPDVFLRALRGLLRISEGQDEQRMVVRLLARVLYDLFQLWRRVPSAETLCRHWDRCMDLAQELSADYDIHVTFKDAEEWKAAVAGGARREHLLEKPLGLSPVTQETGGVTYRQR